MKKNLKYMQRMIKLINLKDDELQPFLEKFLTPKQVMIFNLRFDHNIQTKMTIEEISIILNTSRQNIEGKLTVIYNKIENYVLRRNPSFKKDRKSRKDKLITSIHKRHRLPTIYEDIFNDGTTYKKYYDDLSNDYKKVIEKRNNNEVLSPDEKQLLQDFEEIEAILNYYKNTINLSPKAKIFIKTIEKIHRLPHSKRTKQQKSEFTFKNGQDQRNYYNYLTEEVKKIKMKQKRNESLTVFDKQNLYDYEEIQKVLKKYVKITEKKPKCTDKKEQFIRTIHRLHKLPKGKSKNNDNTAECCVFTNGANQREYYNNLQTRVHHAKENFARGIPLTPTQQQNIKDYTEICNILSFYPRYFKETQEIILDICNKLEISLADNRSLLTKSVYEIYIKLRFMIENNIPLTINKQINQIMYMSDLNMQKEYNISIDELVKIYINGETNSKDAFKQLIK